jgi:hypothetical protein
MAKHKVYDCYSGLLIQDDFEQSRKSRHVLDVLSLVSCARFSGYWKHDGYFLIFAKNFVQK